MSADILFHAGAIFCAVWASTIGFFLKRSMSLTLASCLEALRFSCPDRSGPADPWSVNDHAGPQSPTPAPPSSSPRSSWLACPAAVAAGNPITGAVDVAVDKLAATVLDLVLGWIAAPCHALGGNAAAILLNSACLGPSGFAGD